VVSGENFFDGNYPPGNTGEIDRGKNSLQNTPNTPPCTFSDHEESDSEMAVEVGPPSTVGNCVIDKDGIRLSKKDRLRRQAEARAAKGKLSQKTHEKEGGGPATSGVGEDTPRDQSSDESPTKKGKTGHHNQNNDTS
jgi:hypothetical protein